MIDSGFSDSFCVALDWKAARSCWSGLDEFELVELLAEVESLELELELESEDDTW